jgi:hypothetical protein
MKDLKKIYFTHADGALAQYAGKPWLEPCIAYRPSTLFGMAVFSCNDV